MQGQTLLMPNHLFGKAIFLVSVVSMLLIIVGLQEAIVGKTVINSVNENSTADSNRTAAILSNGKIAINNSSVQPILLAPIKISGDSVFIVWPDNRTKPFVSTEAGTNRMTNFSSSTPPNWEIFFVKSSNAGKTFGMPINLSNSPNGSSTGPEIDIHDTDGGINSIFVTYWDNRTGSQAPYLVISRDSGTTFTSPIKLESSHVDVTFE
jgi:hypothetical protein